MNIILCYGVLGNGTRKRPIMIMKYYDADVLWYKHHNMTMKIFCQRPLGNGGTNSLQEEQPRRRTTSPG